MHKDKRSSPVDKRSSPVDKRSTPQSGSVGNSALVLLRGGGDLASGVALRLQRAGLKLVITELAQPLAVRRTVSFAETVYAGRHTIEGVAARRVEPEQVPAVLETDEIPVLVDPNADILLSSFLFLAVIDARLTKQPPSPLPIPVPLHIGLGPGFQAGVNCHAVVETRRSHTLGRVYWSGTTQPDSGQPEGDPRRVLRAAGEGVLSAKAKIGEHVEEGQVVAVVSEHYSVISPISGVLRGLIHDGIPVTKGLKIGDVDPRNDPSACFLVSDKALSIGGAVLEAILTKEEIRGKLFRHAPAPGASAGEGH
ncbi:MAG: EF2563 family selenium-dependent molybdenum hydroxylase system protein [Chloroflexi bacterium]|nr:MAG: EF2563 family selenium-dependent molybdenum hydroxylase system protein [Chloroflexota bacterium]